MLENASSPAEACALCRQKLSTGAIVAEAVVFCCAGCHAVFSILAAQKQLERYDEHPLFQHAVKAGLISNPALLETLQRKQSEANEGEKIKLCLEVSDMWCPSCARVIELILMQQPGILRCTVDYVTDLAVIEFSPRFLSKEEVCVHIRTIGYTPLLFEPDREISQQNQALSFQLAVAIFCSLNLMMFAYPIYASFFHYDEGGYGSLFAWLSLFMSLPVLGYSAIPIYKRFWTALHIGAYGMEALVVLSVGAATIFSMYELFSGGIRVYFDSMAIIVTFVLVGKTIEGKAKQSAKQIVRRLTQSLPRRGRKCLPDGTTQFVPIKEIQPGDHLLVCTGEKIVLDGRVIGGEGACDESLVTGEAVPIHKIPGAEVVGGAILQSGTLTLEVIRGLDHSFLQKMIQMVEGSIAKKQEEESISLLEQIIKWFVPLILLIAFSTALGCFYWEVIELHHSVAETALLRAISILLIACPCAIGIATPLAESQLLQSLASIGALVRNRAVLALLGRETFWIFDKTGTVTEGKFTVVQGLEKIEGEYLTALKSLTAHSTHPIANAIHHAIDAPLMEFDRVEEIPGKGMRAQKGAQVFLLGSREFIVAEGAAPDLFEKCAQEVGRSGGIETEVYFTRNQALITGLTLGDRIRPGFHHLIEKLHPTQALLLSGDSEAAVLAVSKVCGFVHWRARATPQEKQLEVLKLRQQGHLVAMLGDGINDAPALGCANISLSSWEATDISIQVSDILLTTTDPDVLFKMRLLAAKGRRVVSQNLFWAFFYNVIGVVFAAGGYLSPIYASGAMAISSLIVLVNAKRISE